MAAVSLGDAVFVGCYRWSITLCCLRLLFTVPVSLICWLSLCELRRKWLPASRSACHGLTLVLGTSVREQPPNSRPLLLPCRRKAQVWVTAVACKLTLKMTRIEGVHLVFAPMSSVLPVLLKPWKCAFAAIQCGLIIARMQSR